MPCGLIRFKSAQESRVLTGVSPSLELFLPGDKFILFPRGAHLAWQID
jgi:hypothetical protein